MVGKSREWRKKRKEGREGVGRREKGVEGIKREWRVKGGWERKVERT